MFGKTKRNVFSLCLLVTLLSASFASLAFADSNQVLTKIKSAPAITVQSNVNSVGHIKDNDVYLFTPETYSILERMSRGEVFDIDRELLEQARLRPHVFSTYYFIGMLKVRRLLLSPGYTKDDKSIVENFKACLNRANKASKTKKFRTAGLFYKSVCGAGLGLFHGIRGNYFKAHSVGKDGMKSLDRLLKIRSDLEGALLLQGIYNYYTSRFGFFTKLLLRLAGMKAGNYNKGVAQIKKAAYMNGTLNYFTNVFAVYVFAPSGKRRKDALKLANMLVKRYPDNYYCYLLRAYVFEKSKKFKLALKDNQYGRNMLAKDPKSYGDIVVEADIFLMDVRIAYHKVLLNNDYQAMKFLLAWSKNYKPSYADAPILACMYLGHIYTLSGDHEKGMRFYKKMQKFKDAEWMKDVGKRYEKRTMGQRYRLKKAHKAKLLKWLKTHPEIRA